MIARARLLLLSFISLFWIGLLLRPCQAFVIPPPLGSNQPNLQEYRAKRNISFHYHPVHVHPEDCRYLTEAQCEKEDEIAAAGRQRRRRQQHAAEHRRQLSNSIGTFRALVLLVQFTDHVNKTLPTREYFDAMCNTNPLSIKAYLAEQSYGQYNVECDVMDWMMTDNTEAFYADGRSGQLGSLETSAFFQPVLSALDGTVNWTAYDADNDKVLDAVLVLHSGFGSEYDVGDTCGNDPQNRIRSQGFIDSPGEAWKDQETGIRLGGYSISSAYFGCFENRAARIGVPTHEWLHTFGPIDLYDLSTGMLGGLGSFCMMSSPYGPGNDPSLPGSMSPYSKMSAGWLEPTEIKTNGEYTIRASPSEAYIIKDKYPVGEYLLIENRQPTGFDAEMFGNGGLLIYHVDENKIGQGEGGYPGQPGWPGNNKHYLVALLQADGLYELERGIDNGDAQDVWTQGMLLGQGTIPNTDSYQSGTIERTGITITDISASGNEMTFRVAGLAEATNSPTPAPFSAPPTQQPTASPVTSTVAGNVGDTSDAASASVGARFSGAVVCWMTISFFL